MEIAEIVDVATVLIKSTPLLENIWRFTALTEISVGIELTLKNRLNSGRSNYFDCFSEILAEWTERLGEEATVERLSNILAGMDCKNSGEIIKEKFGKNARILRRRFGDTEPSLQQTSETTKERGTGSSRITWKILDPVQHFVGREEEIKMLNRFIATTGRRIIVISGMGGQGKSQLCRQWMQILKNEKTNPFGLVWLATDSGHSFLTSLLEFAKSIDKGFDESRKEIQKEIEEKILSKLNEKMIWVLDNVDTFLDDVNEFCVNVITIQPQHKIVITSRLNNIFSGFVDHFKLQTLSREAAKQLVRKRLGEQPDNEVNSLIEKMGCYALALHLATGAIERSQTCSTKGNGYTIQTFLDTYDKTKKSILDSTDPISNYNNTIPANVKMSLASVQNQKPKKVVENIMIFLSICRHDGVDLKFLSDTLLSIICTDVVEIEACVTEIKAVSLLDCENEVITIHPLVQESVLRLLHKKWKLFALKVLDSAHIVLGKSPPSIFKNYIKIWEAICQEDSMLKKRTKCMESIYIKVKNSYTIHSTILPFAEGQKENLAILFQDEEDELPERVAAVENFLKLIKPSQSVLKNMKIEVQRAEQIFKDSPQTMLDIKEDLARIYQIIDCPENAVGIYEEQLSQFMDQEIIKARINQNLAVNRRMCGEVVEALCLFNEALDCKKQYLAEYDPEILFIHLNIGLCLLRQKHCCEAMAKFEYVISLQKDGSAEQASTKGWLGLCLIKLRRFKEAISILDNVAKILGPLHPQAAINGFNYAYCLRKLGFMDAAAVKGNEVVGVEIDVSSVEHNRAKAILGCLKTTLKIYEDGNLTNRQRVNRFWCLPIGE